MVYERYTRDRQSGDYFGRPNSQDYGRDFRSDGGGYARSSAREYEAAGEYDRENGPRSSEGGRQGYGDPRSRQSREARGPSYGRQPNDRGGSQRGYGETSEYHGSYASDGRRFEDVGRNRHADDDNYRGRDTRGTRGDYGRSPQGYDHDDRGFIARAGDEVRSWFGDDDAERRREEDARYEEREQRGRPSNPHDDHYHSWRSTQIAALDRDYDEYRNENRSKFETEFGSWRTERQGQRAALSRVAEHMEVVGSDGSHVGTVDKVRGDRILLTKSDKDAGGIHHSIPSRWIASVDTQVKLAKSADDAKSAWKDEERSTAVSDYGDTAGRDRADAAGKPSDDLTKGRTLDKSFSGTY